MRKIAFIAASALCLLVACSSTKPVEAPKAKENTVTVKTVPWTFPGIKVNRAHCTGEVADCFEMAGQLCQPRGAIAQKIDDHDVIFICRPVGEADDDSGDE